MSLPELSRAADAVRTRIRDAHDALRATIDNRDSSDKNLAEAYGKLGALFVAAEYLESAESCFLNAQALAPQDMRWPYYLGHLSRLRNQPAEALAFFEQARERAPDEVTTLVWLGEMQLAQGHADAAEAWFTKAAARQPDEPAALYGLGRAALVKQNYAATIRYLEQALRARPHASRLHHPLAMAYRAQGDRRAAEAHLAQRGDGELLPSDPLMEQLGALLQNAAAYEIRGSEALGRRQWAEAASQLREAVKLAPDHAVTRQNLGTALFLSGDGQGAVEQLEAALRLRPDLAKAHYGLGLIMETNGRDREAIEHFEDAVKHDVSDVEARLQLADALRRNDRLDEALLHYREVVNRDFSASQAHFGLAMALVRLGRYGDARDQLTAATRTFPEQPGFPHALARVLAAAPDDRVRDGPKALGLMRDLLKTQQSIPLAETMAMVYAELGQFDQAVSWQRRAIAAATRARRQDLVLRMGDNLKQYEGRRPCRIPWALDDPVHHPRPADASAGQPAR